MKKVFLFVAISLTALFISAPEKLAAQNSDTLKILSWNIYMLPVSIKNVGQGKRVQFIAEQMNASDYDVIVFQEAFDRDARYRLSKFLRKEFPFQEGPANAKPSWFRMNSGVWILSRHPMKYLDELDFSNAKGVDKVARKGMLLVEINKNGKTYQVAGTHLQSGASVKNDKIRYRQFLEIKEFLEPHTKDDVAQIICGDFNTPKNDRKNYNLMIETLKAQDGPYESSLQTTYCSKQNELAYGSNYSEVLDYIFIRENNINITHVSRCIKAFQGRWHHTRNNLSDHFAVELTVVTE